MFRPRVIRSGIPNRRAPRSPRAASRYPLGVAQFGVERAHGHPAEQLDAGRADLAGDRHRLLGDHQIGLGGVLEQRLAGHQRVHVGLDRGRPGRLHQAQRVGQLRVAARPVEVAEHPGPVHPEPGGAQRVLALVHQLERPLGQAQAALPVTGLAGRDHRLGQHVHQPQPLAPGVALLGVAGARRVGLGPVVRAQGGPQGLLGDLVPQLDGPLQQAELLGEGVAAPGGPGGVRRARQRAGRIVRAVPVVGQPGRALVAADQRRIGLQGLGEAAVDPGPLARQQIVRDRLADQRVPEPVALAVLVGLQDVGADRAAQRVEQFVLGVVQHGFEQLVLDPRAALGGDPHHPLGLLGQRLDPHQQDVAQRVAQPHRAALLVGAGQLLHEERVALGAAVDPGHQLAVRHLDAQDAGQLGGHLLAAEPVQLQPVHGALALQLGEEGAQRVAAVQVVGAVGGQDQHPGPVQGADQVAEQFPGGAVGPVQVLDRQHQGALGTEAFEEPADVLEQPGPAVLVVGLGVGLAELGQQPGELTLHALRGLLQLRAQPPVQPAQRGDQRGVRQALGPDLQAVAEHGDGGRPLVPLRPAEELLQQPGLAHPRLAAHQQRLRLPGGGTAQRRGQ